MNYTTIPKKVNFETRRSGIEMKFKKLTLSTLALLAVIPAATPAFAVSGSIDFKDAAYAPNSGNWSYTNSTSSSYVYANLNSLKYSSDRIAVMQTDAMMGGYYPGVDIKNTNHSTKLDALLPSSTASNYPNPYYDIDDDTEPKDGYDDEAEVVCLAPSQMNATTSYRFSASFKKNSSSGTGKLLYSAQRSSLWPGGEYNVVAWQPLRYYLYDLSKSVSSVAKDEVKTKRKDVKASKKVPLLSEQRDSGYQLSVYESNGKVKALIVPQEDKLDEYVSYNKELAEQLIEDKEKNIAVTITFEEPQSLKSLQQFEKKYGLKLSEYNGRAFDENGDKITFAGFTDSIKKINLDELVEVSGVEDKDQISGIFTLRGEIKTSKDLESLLKNKDIYLVDVMENSLDTKEIQKKVKKKVSAKAADHKVEVNVHNPFWFIEKE